MTEVKYNSHCKSEKGSVFFYILLGVALFATLSFTVSRGMRGSQTNAMSDRKAGLATSEIFDYAQKIEHAVNKLRRKGCSENDISFDHALWGHTDYEHTPTIDNKCKVFHVSGGSVDHKEANKEWLDSSKSGQPRYGRFFFTGSAWIPSQGSDNSDELILGIPYLKKNLCMEINKKLGNTNTLYKESDGPYDLTAPFTGNYTNGNPGPDNDLGYVSGCSEGDGAFFTLDGAYYYYHVLIAR